MSAIEDGAMQEKAWARIDDLVKRLSAPTPECPFDSRCNLEPTDPCPVCGDLGVDSSAPSNCQSTLALRKEAAAELTRLRERNAELERGIQGIVALQSSVPRSAMREAAAEILKGNTGSLPDQSPFLKRIASLEVELDIANKQIAATGRAWTADRTRLEALLKETGK